MKDRERWIIGCFIAASGLVLFFNLWARTLENHDYLRHAEVAREMMRSGDWVVLRLNGEIYLDKLPFFFWLISIPASLYGVVTPLIARLPSAVSAWMGVIVLFFWGKRIYRSPWAGLLSGGVLLSTYQYFSYARTARPDMVLCVLILFCLYFFYLGYEEASKKKYLFHGLSFFSMGLAVLTKGPIPLLIPLAVMAAFLIKEKQTHLFLSKEFLLGCGLLVITVLPWILLFVSRLGFDQTLTLVEENRILSRQAPFYFYFSKIWAEFLPWSLFLPVLGVFVWKNRKKIWFSRESFFLIWFILLFVGLTVIKYRASRYLLPALPPLALMIGGMGRKKIRLFLIPLSVSILIWHGVEIYWANKNLSRSPGIVLTGELRPLLGEATLYGYRLDVSTLEEINFYLDRVTPNLKRYDNLSKALEKEEGALILMQDKLYEKIQRSGNDSMIFIRGFQYKEGKLVLVSGRVDRRSLHTKPASQP